MTTRCECCGQPIRQRIQTPFTQARVRAGILTQVEAAAKVGICQSRLSKYERGDLVPGTKVLLKMADAYGATVDELLGRNQRIA